MRYRVKHSKRNSISKRAQLLFSIYLSPERRGAHTFNQVRKGEGISRSNRVQREDFGKSTVNEEDHQNTTRVGSG